MTTDANPGPPHDSDESPPTIAGWELDAFIEACNEVGGDLYDFHVRPDGRLVFVRSATVDYAGPKGYQQGASAPLSLWIVNDTQESVSLVGVGAVAVATDGRTLPVQVTIRSGAASAAPCVVPRSPSPAALPTTSASGGAPPTATPKSSVPGTPPVSGSASAARCPTR